MKSLLSKISFCVAINDARYYLTGLLLEIGNGNIFLVGTDGHRMAIAQHHFDISQMAKVVALPLYFAYHHNHLLPKNHGTIGEGIKKSS